MYILTYVENDQKISKIFEDIDMATLEYDKSLIDDRKTSIKLLMVTEYITLRESG